MSKLESYRHGEILFVETKEIPKEATLKDTNVLIKGSGNNPHSFKNGKFYELNKGFIFGYFEAKDTILCHVEHGDTKVGNLLEAQLPDGVYELRKGQEWINQEMKPVID